MATGREIAQLCGVSVATVSRVFNQPDTVNEDTRERVLRVAKELDYRPNESARALSTKQSTMIGLVWDTDHRRPGWRHPYLQDLLIGLKSALSAHGYHLLMLATSGDSREIGVSLADPVGYVNTTRRHHLGGLVLIDSGSDGDAFEAFAQSGFPCVALDVAVDGPRATYVTSDNVGGALSAVRHLVGLGHSRIAMITGPPGNQPSEARVSGYRTALREAGIVPRDDYVVMRRLLPGERNRCHATASGAGRAAHRCVRGQRRDGGRRTARRPCSQPAGAPGPGARRVRRHRDRLGGRSGADDGGAGQAGVRGGGGEGDHGHDHRCRA